jgi:hypothetical protein
MPNYPYFILVTGTQHKKEFPPLPMQQKEFSYVRWPVVGVSLPLPEGKIP